MAKLVDKSFHVQKGSKSSSRGDGVHTHIISLLQSLSYSIILIPTPTQTIASLGYLEIRVIP
jgi:hypothetical protein